MRLQPRSVAAVFVLPNKLCCALALVRRGSAKRATEYSVARSYTTLCAGYMKRLVPFCSFSSFGISLWQSSNFRLPSVLANRSNERLETRFRTALLPSVIASDRLDLCQADTDILLAGRLRARQNRLRIHALDNGSISSAVLSRFQQLSKGSLARSRRDETRRRRSRLALVG